MPISREQLRLTPAELDALMDAAKTLHAGTVSPKGMPHVAPLWFVWRDGEIWINSLRRSRRGRDLTAGSPVSLCVDAGDEYGELRGAVLYGAFTDASQDPALPEILREFSRRYWGGIEVPQMKSHDWLRMKPERIVSWDFRKIPKGRDKRLEASKPDKE
ncbi:MAG: pyridoxamine 5'-phosphate oxidase family protein [Actinomycetota bacterium]